MTRAGPSHLPLTLRQGNDRQILTDRPLGRWVFVTLLASSIVWSPLVSHAQQPKSLKHVGLLSMLGCEMPRDNPGSRRLAELGWIEGQNYVVECVSTAGRVNQLPSLAHELVARHADVMITTPASFVRALKQETTTTPILMLATPDPVRTGLVTNLARPEGNVTGVAWFGFDILPKRIELLKEIVPDLRRLAIIRTGYGDSRITEIMEENIAYAAITLGFTWQNFRPLVAEDYDEIFGRIAAEHFDAAYITSDPLSNQPQNGTRIVRLALRYLIPAIAEGPGLAKQGLLLNYTQDISQDAVHVSEYVDKILHGAKPSELPVERATNLQLVINLKTAKALGLTVPSSLLARAHEVIE